MSQEPMLAITVQQPWAWAIVYPDDPKNIENRTRIGTWRRAVGKRVAVHAGQRWSDRGAAALVIRTAWWTEHSCCDDGEPVPDQALPRDLIHEECFGAIIGTVDIVDVHPASPACDPEVCQPWGEESYVEHGGGRRVDVVHLVLERPVPVHPIPCRGALGLWTVPDGIAAVLV